MSKSSIRITYADQEHSKLYIRKENTEEHIYLDFDQAKRVHMILGKYVG